MLNRRLFLGSASLAACAPALANDAAGFQHGVASGDPLADRVILWSRLSGYTGTVEARLEVATNPDFSRVVRKLTLTTSSARDFTLKADVDGLEPGTHYYYRFRTDQHDSAVGRTRTLPAAGVEAVRLAVVSCSNYPAGYFNVYRALGHYNDLDAVLHLGDYIYEYPENGYASERAAEFDRVVDPKSEILSLDDYRRRYRQYRSDPDLQYAHGRLPFIVIWDDHEITNDAWVDGAQNHSADEGDYHTRVAVALQAFYEWLPVREPDSGALESPFRAFDFGGLATLAMIESRLTARQQPVNSSSDLNPAMSWYRRESRRQYSYAGEALPAGASADAYVSLPAIASETAEGPVRVTDYALNRQLAAADSLGSEYHFVPDTAAFRELLNDPARQMLGEQQLDWLGGVFEKSAASNVPWQILGNQTLLSNVQAPNFARALSRQERNALPSYIRGLVPLSQYDLPINLDAWDGYPAARERLYDRVARPASMVTLAGDTHNAWAGPLRRGSGGQRIGYEFGTPSVSSPGLAETFGISGERLKDLLATTNPHFDYLEMTARGYLVVTLTAEQASGQYHFVNRIDDRRFFTRADSPINLKI